MSIEAFGLWLEITELSDEQLLAMAELTLHGQLDVTRETREGLLEQLWQAMLEACPQVD